MYLRWEFVFQPTYAAYLNLIESWWKILWSLALEGRRFATWDEIARTVERATAYWAPTATLHPGPPPQAPAPPEAGYRAHPACGIDLVDEPLGEVPPDAADYIQLLRSSQSEEAIRRK